MVNNTAIKQTSLQNNIQNAINHNHGVKSYIIAENNETSMISQDNCYFKELAQGKSLDGPFLWDKKVQGFILSSYFYGYTTTQILGGFLSIKLGAKFVLAGAILIGSVLTIIIPFAATLNYIALIACRFFTGVAHGAFWPAMSTLWSYWAPPTERSRLAGIANAGAQIGNVVALSFGGFLCVYGFDGGWPSIFYVFGLIGVLWFIVWMIFAANSPAENRFISEKERQYIINNTKETSANARHVPLYIIGKIFRSRPFWGTVIAHTFSNFGTYLFLTQLPTYMKEILKFDIKSNGSLSSLPYIAFWLLTVVSSIIGDKLIESKKLSKTKVRKLFNTLGLVLPLVAVLGLVFVTCKEPYIGVALLTLGLATTGCGFGAGFMVNYNDIAGRFAGLSFGIGNTFGSIPGFIAPYVVGSLTTNQKQEEWRIVFYITAIFYLVGVIGYLLLGSGELELWAIKKSDDFEAKNEIEEAIPLKANKL